ncbi:phage baseplate assembly protein V [Halomonas sp. MCCC 1A17488]|uniref:phage baseplate assembly protein V n=1 Tax=unclassified Halomonas TaxID=2609666 RepID=UPI0018D26148|nr:MULTISPECIES: phage baseplate assembly protein V [unclassified Halomonas]MCE8015912.1 phage baseplate assembly protein V [Halomonas sp. MCCC 1A17488]MCG3239245.1 phage baseplate assembly protein V [Halomonas sp. MCCC 1A17488]QPP50820.1 phage baseplate assembly protein V [Halomonas sp. SS10-MC5]
MNPIELLRLLHNLIRLGTVHEVDHARARVRVVSGELVTDWLPWLSPRAGTTRDWSPPTVGEQVLVLSPGGDPAAGAVLTGIYSDTHPAPADSSTLCRQVMPDGAVLEYDHEVHHLAATLPGSATLNAQGEIKVTTTAKLTATAAEGATINADTTINGRLSIVGDSVTHNGTNIGATHKHGGVVSGGSLTGVPSG